MATVHKSPSPGALADRAHGNSLPYFSPSDLARATRDWSAIDAYCVAPPSDADAAYRDAVFEEIADGLKYLLTGVIAALVVVYFCAVSL